MLWNTDGIDCGRELVKMCDFYWYRAVCLIVVRAVLMAKLSTEGGWMECVRWYGGIGALTNNVECSRGWDR